MSVLKVLTTVQLKPYVSILKGVSFAHANLDMSVMASIAQVYQTFNMHMSNPTQSAYLQLFYLYANIHFNLHFFNGDFHSQEYINNSPWNFMMADGVEKGCFC